MTFRFSPFMKPQTRLIIGLRALMQGHRSPSKPYKPVPYGFNQDMAHARKVLSKGEQA